MKNAYIYETTIGKILIAEDELGITELTLASEQEAEDKKEQFALEYVLLETELIKEAAKQLTEYLEGTRKEFTVKLNPKGTEFQRKVWDALRAIPYGETRSYKQVAEAVGNAKASRAIGMANHNNPIMCIIPCHRVIGANGSLVGYAGGLPVKEHLLNLEKQKERK
jgi:methylated-DNA-[protein]-cysteine S-methyltransferase